VIVVLDLQCVYSKVLGNMIVCCLWVSSYDDSWLGGYHGHMMPPPPMRGARFARPPHPMIPGRGGYRAAAAGCKFSF